MDGRNMEMGSNANGTGGGVGGLSPTISFWFRLNRVILRLCTTHQFKNLQVRIYTHMYVRVCGVVVRAYGGRVCSLNQSSIYRALPRLLSMKSM